MSNRWALLIIDGHASDEAPISLSLPQGLPVSLILFILYIRLLATAIEDAILGVRGLSFIDNQGLITVARSV